MQHNSPFQTNDRSENQAKLLKIFFKFIYQILFHGMHKQMNQNLRKSIHGGPYM